MKIRTGFISNSSSSSFIIAERDLKPENFNSFEYKKYDNTIIKIDSKSIVNWIKRNYDKKMKVKDIINKEIYSSFFYDDVFDKVLKKYLKEKGVKLDWREMNDEKGKSLKDILINIFYDVLKDYYEDYIESGDEVLFFRFLFKTFDNYVDKYLINTYYIVFDDFEKILKKDNNDPLEVIKAFQEWYDSFFYSFGELCEIDMKELNEKINLLLDYLERCVDNIDKQKIVNVLMNDVLEIEDNVKRVIENIKKFKDDEEMYVFEVYGSGDGWQDNIGSPMYEVGKEVWDKNNKVIYYED